MRDELETILDCDVKLTHQDEERSTYNLCHEEQVIVENGSDGDRLFDAIQSLQQSLPNDLEERREGAIDFLEEKYLGLKTTGWLESRHDTLRAFERDKTKGSEFCAWKRVLGIHDGNFGYEHEYYPKDNEPDYPEQWLEHMSEESAGWLYRWLENHGFSTVKHPQTHEPPTELKKKDLVVWCRSHPEIRAYSTRSPFLTGGLELPDCIDEEEL